MDYKEHHRLNQEFLEKFPLEKLKDMTIEQYTDESRGQALDPGTQNDRFLLCILTHSIRNDVF